MKLRVRIPTCNGVERERSRRSKAMSPPFLEGALEESNSEAEAAFRGFRASPTRSKNSRPRMNPRSMRRSLQIFLSLSFPSTLEAGDVQNPQPPPSRSQRRAGGLLSEPCSPNRPILNPRDFQSLSLAFFRAVTLSGRSRNTSLTCVLKGY